MACATSNGSFLKEVPKTGNMLLWPPCPAGSFDDQEDQEEENQGA
jgi:hypothetical protein